MLITADNGRLEEPTALAVGPLGFSDAQFQTWSALLQHRLGMDPRSLRWTFISRSLAQRLQQLGLQDLEQYYQLLHSERAPASEWITLLDLVTTHETRCFRQPQALDAAATHYLQTRDSSRPYRAWCAGCSTGEEAWSLAMTLAEQNPDFSDSDFSVLGTDISQRCLFQATQGDYPQRQIKDVPEELIRRWFDRSGFETVRIKPRLRSQLSFSCMNLLTPGGIRPGCMDLVISHNVLIYLDRDHRRQALDNMAATLRPGGMLIAGPGETHDWQAPTMQRVSCDGLTMFSKDGTNA